MSRHGHRSPWASRLGLIVCLAAFAAFPIALYRLAGGMPPLPHLTTWSALKAFFRSSDDTAFSKTIQRNGERVAWVLWFYLVVTMAMEVLARILERFGRPWLRATWEQVQPRSALAAINLVMTLALAAAPRFGQGVAAAASLPAATSPQRPDPPGGGAPPPPVPAQLTAVYRGAPAPESPGREHVVRQGETLWEVAATECGSPLYWRDIAEENGVADPTRLEAGTKLTLPAACEVPEYRPYVVEPGDSLTRVARREYGTATAASAIWEVNRDRVMADGRTFSDPNKIYPDWTLRLPTNVAVSAPAPAAAAPGPPAPAAPSQVPTQAAAPATTPAPDNPPAVAKPPAVAPVATPAKVPSAAPQRSSVRNGETTAATHTQGVRVPGGFWPYCFAASVFATGFLARLRRRATRRLDRPEPRRRLGPVLGAVSGSPRVVDAITPHTLALLGVYQAAGRPVLPRVLGAWEVGPQSFQFLLDEAGDIPEAGVDEGSGIEVTLDVRDGHVIAETAGQARESLRREVVPFVDEILVPVGGDETNGWLLLPLLNEPLALVGDEADDIAESMLMAAGLRAGDEFLTISIGGELLADARFPERVEFPAPQRLGPAELADLPNTLAKEAELREGVLQAEGYDSFAGLQTQWPSLLSAWVLVLDAATAEACASELGRLATLGVGALVMGDSPVAKRRISADGGRVSVTAPGIDVDDLMAFRLSPGLANELEAETTRLPLDLSEAGDDESDDEVPAIEEPVANDKTVVSVVDQPTSRVRICVLGGFDVTRDGVEVPGNEIRSAQARELVAYLAVAGDWVSANELREILWADDLDPTLRRNPLYQQVSKARAWLLGNIKDASIIEHRDGKNGNPGSYRLLAWVDVVAFRALAARGTPDALEEAAGLYRGELLAGQDSDDHYQWVRRDGQREAERDRYHAVVARLAESLMKDGKPAKALSVLEPALGTRDGAATEGLARIAMRCEAALANGDGVRRRYGRLTAALEQEKASAETSDLLEGLLASLERSPQPPTPPRPSGRRRPSEAPADVPSLRVVNDSEMSAAGGGS
jgi:DNA-binding SARP family transcriptional activator/LysM repeat protein